MKKQIISLAAISLMVFSAHASELTYNYAELGYSSADLGDSIDGDGLKIAGSFSLTDDIYAFSDYASYSLPASADFGYLGIGIGYRYEISSNTDLQFDAAFRSADLDIAGTANDSDENGYEFGFGIRSLINPNIELGARIESVDINGRDTFFEINGHYYFSNSFAVGAEASFGDELDIFTIKVRYSF